MLNLKLELKEACCQYYCAFHYIDILYWEEEKQGLNSVKIIYIKV